MAALVFCEVDLDVERSTTDLGPGFRGVLGFLSVTHVWAWRPGALGALLKIKTAAVTRRSLDKTLSASFQSHYN